MVYSVETHTPRRVRLLTSTGLTYPLAQVSLVLAGAAHSTLDRSTEADRSSEQRDCDERWSDYWLLVTINAADFALLVSQWK